MSGDQGRARSDVIKKHLAALKQFAEDDLQAALDEETYDDGDDTMVSDADDSDEEPAPAKGKAVTARAIAV